MNFYYLKKNLKLNLNKLVIHVIAVLFKLIGLAPFNVKMTSIINKTNEKKKLLKIKIVYSKLGSFYNFIISFYIFYLIYVIMHSGIKYAQLSKIDKTVRVLLSILEHVSIFIIVSTYCFTQKKIVEILNGLLKLDDMLMNNLYNDKLLNNKLYQLMIFTLQLIIPIVLFIIETIDEKKFKLNIFTHTISTIFINSSIGQYVGVLVFLNKRFEIINYLIIKFPTFNDSNNPCEIMMTNGFRNSLSKMELKFIRRNFYNYYKITEDVKKFYSPLILVVVVHWSLSLAYICYMMLRYIIYDKDVTVMKHVIEILWLFRTLFPFALLTSNVTAINNQVCMSFIYSFNYAPKSWSTRETKKI